MPSGKIASANLEAGSITSVYTVPNGQLTACTVSLGNRNALEATVRLALADTETPDDADWIEYDVRVARNGVLERSGLMLSAGQRVVAYSDLANVSVVVYGVEEAV